MRVTIESTTEEYSNKVVVEEDSDELTTDKAIYLISRALVAYGYSDKNIRGFCEQVANNVSWE